MKAKRPPLIEGIDWIETPRYSVVLRRQQTYQIPLYGHNLDFYAGDLRLGWLNEFGILCILPGYACDGYSPCIKILGKWIRLTPTPKAGMFPAVLHDFTRQFCDTAGCPWNREQTDTWFYNAMVHGGSNKHIAGIYYGAVSRTIGNIYHHFRKHDPTLEIIMS
jgi:hypothetical protein